MAVKVSKGLKMTDKKLLVKKMVNTYGGVELDKDEEDFLLLGLEFALFEPLLRQKAK